MEACQKLSQVHSSASSKLTTEFAQPRLSRSSGGHPQREGTNLGVFGPCFDWYCPGVRLQIWVCLICVISPTQTELCKFGCGLGSSLTRLLKLRSLRYPISCHVFLSEVSTPPRWCNTPLCYLDSHRHICAIPHFATYRARDNCSIPHTNKHERV